MQSPHLLGQVGLSHAIPPPTRTGGIVPCNPRQVGLSHGILFVPSYSSILCCPSHPTGLPMTDTGTAAYTLYQLEDRILVH